MSAIFSASHAAPMPCLSLGLSLFYFLPLVDIGNTGPFWTVKMLALYTFLVAILFACAFSSIIRVVVPSAIGLVVVASFGAGFYSGSFVFYAYAIWFFSFHLPISLALLGAIFVLMSMFITALSIDLGFRYYFPILIPWIFIFMNANSYRHNVKLQKGDSIASSQGN